MKADRKARKEVHGFRRAYQCTYVCDRCLACKTSAKKSVQELNFANMSRTAPWRATQFSHEDYVAQERVCSPFVQVPGFRLETAWSDMMHDMYLGVAGDAIANSLVEIWEYGLLRSNNGEPYAEPIAAFKHVQLDMQMWFRQRGLSPPPHQFNLAVLGRNSYQNPPELSSKFKAAQVKQLVPWLADFAGRFAHVGYRHQVRATLLWSLARYIQVLDEAGRWMQDDEIASAMSAGELFLDCFSELAALALQANEALWKIRPKLHYMCHSVADLASGWNCRFDHCFMDEDFVGKMASLGRQCHRRTASLRILQRYVTFQSQRWHARTGFRL